MKRPRGFTLIELLLVVVLLAILAVTALPKFADLSSKAKTDANRSTGAAFSSAINIVHASWIAQGNNNTATTISLLEGTNQSINTNTSGWPSCAGGEIACTNPPVNVADCQVVWNSILKNPPSLTTGTSCTGNGCYYVTLTNGVCTYSLGPAAASTYTITYTPETGQVFISP